MEGHGLFRQFFLHFPQLRNVRHIYKDDQIDRTALLPAHTGSIYLQPELLPLPVFYIHGKMQRLSGQNVFSLPPDSFLIVPYIPLIYTVFPAFRFTAEIFCKAGIRFQKDHVEFLIDPVFRHKTGKVIVCDGLLLLHLDHVINIGYHCVPHLISVHILIREPDRELYPDMLPALSPHPGCQFISFFSPS